MSGNIKQVENTTAWLLGSPALTQMTAPGEGSRRKMMQTWEREVWQISGDDQTSSLLLSTQKQTLSKASQTPSSTHHPQPTILNPGVELNASEGSWWKTEELPIRSLEDSAPSDLFAPAPLPKPLSIQPTPHHNSSALPGGEKAVGRVAGTSPLGHPQGLSPSASPPCWTTRQRVTYLPGQQQQQQPHHLQLGKADAEGCSPLDTNSCLPYYWVLQVGTQKLSWERR